MCGRYAYTLPHEAVRRLYKLENLVDTVPRYNIAPTQPILAIWEDAGIRAARLARWGLVPGWVKDPRDFPLLVNARSETARTKPAFRDAMRHQRCIVPASGYYEWRTDPGGKKQPFYITRQDGEPMSLAGLYSIWCGPEGEEVDTVALMTVPANNELSVIHDRMPAVLEREGIDPWLDTRTVDAGAAHMRARPLPDGVVAFHPVSTRVNSAQNEGPDLIEAVGDVRPEPGTSKGLKVKKKTTSQLDLF